MIKITSDNWEVYHKKYTKLMWKISHMISGDLMLASIEDNYSDLCIAALESINGFHKKTGMMFDQMINSKLFDQYTKTCLWTAKARKGVKLTDRMQFTNKHVSIDDLKDRTFGEYDFIDSSSCSRYNNSPVEPAIDIPRDSTNLVSRFVDLLKSDSSLVTNAGKVKLGSVAKHLKVTPRDVRNIIKYLKEKQE